MASPASPAPAPPAAPEDRVVTGPFLRVMAGNFCFFMTFASFFLLPLYIRELGGTEETVGFVMGSGGLASLLGVILITFWIDRMGPRFFLRLGTIGMACTALGFAAATEIDHLYVLRILQGFCFAAGFNGASTIAASLAPPSRRARALGLFGVSTLTTHAIAPTLGEALLGVMDYQGFFAAAAGYSMLAAALGWGLPDTRTTVPGTTGRLPLSRGLYVTFFTTMSFGLSFGSVITFIPTFTRAENLGTVSTFFLSYTAAAVGTRLWAGGLADSLGKRVVAVPSLAVLGLSIAALSTVQTPIVLGAVGVVFGLAQGVAYPTLNAFGVDLAPEGQLGRVQSMFNGCFNLGITCGAFVFGPVAASLGHRAMFVAAGTSTVVGAAVFFAGSGSEAET